VTSETTAAVSGAWAARAVHRWVDRIGSLFRAAPPAQTGWRKAMVAVAAVLAGTVVSLARQRVVPATDSLWAEDGGLFLVQAITEPALPTVVEPYNGYFQVLPRLLSLPLAVLPLGWAAAYVAISAAAFTALLALVVYVASAAHLPSRLARGLVAAVPLVVPVGTDEVPNSICNLHWAGLYALFWVLLWVPAQRTGKIVALALVPLIAATNIVAAALVPLAVLRLIGRRDGHSRAVGILAIAGVAAHVVALVVGVSSRETQSAVLEPARMLVTYVLPAGIFGDELLPATAPVGQQTLLAVLGWSVVASIVVVAGLGITRPNWRLAGLAFGTAALLWLVCAGTGGFTVRYAATPAMLIVAGLVALVLPRPGRAGSIRPLVPMLCLATLLVSVWAVNYRLIDNQRAAGPRWSESLAAARQTCAGMAPDTVVEVPIAPAGWAAVLPCHEILR